MRFLIAAVVVLCLASAGVAQEHELAFGVGAHIPFNDAFDTQASVAGQFNYANRIVDFPGADLYLEFPVVVGFNADIAAPLFGLSRTSYSSLFVTPGLKLKLAPLFPTSPFLTIGGGWARFRVGPTENSPEQITNTGVLMFGGGADFKIAPFLSLRGEVRDFYSGAPRVTVDIFQERQHNVVVSGALVLRF